MKRRCSLGAENVLSLDLIADTVEVTDHSTAGKGAKS